MIIYYHAYVCIILFFFSLQNAFGDFNWIRETGETARRVRFRRTDIIVSGPTPFPASADVITSLSDYTNTAFTLAQVRI